MSNDTKDELKCKVCHNKYEIDYAGIYDANLCNKCSLISRNKHDYRECSFCDDDMCSTSCTKCYYRKICMDCSNHLKFNHSTNYMDRVYKNLFCRDCREKEMVGKIQTLKKENCKLALANSNHNINHNLANTIADYVCFY
jgi:hypothetical protein